MIYEAVFVAGVKLIKLNGGLMEAKKDLRNDLLDKVDEVDLVRHHFRTMFTAGMGFFTDAYDLFIIGVVIALLTPIWHLEAGR